MTYRKYLIYLYLWISFFIIIPANSALGTPTDPVSITSSPSPKGSGGRAIAMGRSFLSVADDATAASWNPGCLIQLLTPELSVVFTYSFKNELNDIYGEGIDTEWKQHLHSDALNYASLSLPYELFQKNMVFSLNYLHLYDFSRVWNCSFQQQTLRSLISRNIHFQQSGKLSAVGIAWCIQIIPTFAVGITLNFWNDNSNNQWNKNSIETGEIINHSNNKKYTYKFFSKDTYSFDGFNTNLGLFWKISNQIRMGAVLKTPFTAELNHVSEFSSEVINTATSNISKLSYPPITTHEHMDMPASYGIGISYHPSRKWVFSADVYHIEWQNFLIHDDNGSYSLISGVNEQESSVNPATQFHMGMEYLFFHNARIFPVRCGFFYEPAPAEKTHDDFFGITLGTGLTYQSYHFDLAYEFRFGNNVGQSVITSNQFNFSQDVNEHSLYASFIYHF